MSKPEELTEAIELTLTESELCTYALLAHEADMTLNDWFKMVIEEQLRALESEHEQRG